MVTVKKKVNSLNNPIVESVIYQGKNGGIEFRGDLKNETIWATQAQIADIFNIERSVVTKHLSKLFKDGEVSEKSNVQKMHIANSDKPVLFYSVDVILSVGYKTNSKNAIEFRKWASKIIKEYTMSGYVFNRTRIIDNYDRFINAVNDIKLLLPESDYSDTKNVLELVRGFANTWLTLDSYDKESFKSPKITKKKVTLTSSELNSALTDLKSELMSKNEASELFGIDKSRNSLEGIVGNVMQSFGGEDVYKSLEEKAVHLLYFIIKNHPFVDGNKRSGAFAFIWFLNKYKILDTKKISPEGLTAITLLVAESDPKNKDRLIKLIINLLI